MNITSKQVLDLAAKYIGYKEKASNKDLYSFEANAGKGNYTMFQAELAKAGFWNNNKQGYEWCTSFAAWCFWRLCGDEAKQILCLTGDYGASCTAWAGYYKAAGRLFSKPKVGDQYFQRGSDGKPCHTGLVESVSGNAFTTIEGNAGNMVKRVNRRLDSTVYGFGRPYYSIQEEIDMTKDELIKLVDERIEAKHRTIKDIGAVPGALKAEVRELLDCEAINGGTSYADNPDDINMPYDALKGVVIDKRYTDKQINALAEKINLLIERIQQALRRADK